MIATNPPMPSIDPRTYDHGLLGFAGNVIHGPMPRSAGPGTVSGVIDANRRKRFLSLHTLLLAAVVIATPSAGTLLAAPGAAPVTSPVGAVAWRADSRHLPDPVSADPVAVHRFLTAADPADQLDLANTYPAVLGTLDGAPVSLRYAANRRSMHAAGSPFRDRAGQYLLFDPRGRGRVAQVFGDLSTADRIAVLVPGSGNRAANFWRGLGGERYWAPAVQASDLYQAAESLPAARGRFAVIAWLGYATPQGMDEANREGLAWTGAVALNRFVAGLVAVRPQATIALLGHSYGSTVISLAAPCLPPQVTDIAVFGSPGMGVDTVAELGTTARVWAGQGSRDWIRWVPGVRLFGLGHGTKPADPHFGARVFGTADVDDHDHYLSPRTDSLTNLAWIAAFGTDRGGVSVALAAGLRADPCPALLGVPSLRASTTAPSGSAVSRRHQACTFVYSRHETACDCRLGSAVPLVVVP